jgi:hypothetical protein
VPALLQEGSVIETAVEITRGEVRSHEFSKVPATSPRGIGENTDAAAPEGGQESARIPSFMCKAAPIQEGSPDSTGMFSDEVIQDLLDYGLIAFMILCVLIMVMRRLRS